MRQQDNPRFPTSVTRRIFFLLFFILFSFLFVTNCFFKHFHAKAGVARPEKEIHRCTSVFLQRHYLANHHHCSPRKKKPTAKPVHGSYLAAERSLDTTTTRESILLPLV